MDMKKIGAFLKELRKERGLTQEQLAELLLVSGRTVSRWETGTNMPDLSILIQIAEFYDLDMKEILDGERKSGTMDKELKETLSKAADYGRLEKEKAVKAGSTAFMLTFVVCAASIVIQLIAAGELRIVVGETLTLLFGGIAYIGIMVHNGVWENGSRVQSMPVNDALISVLCSGVFTVILVFFGIRSGAALSLTVAVATAFFAGIAVLGFIILRVLAGFNKKALQKEAAQKET